MWLGLYESCDRFDDVNICIILGMGYCDYCPYGLNYNREKIPKEPSVVIRERPKSIVDMVEEMGFTFQSRQGKKK